MAVLAPMKNTIPMNIGYGDYSNEPDVIIEESSFGYKLVFRKTEKEEACSLLKSFNAQNLFSKVWDINHLH